MNLDLDKFKTLLETRQAELQNWAEASKETTQPVELDQTTQGRVSRIDAIQQQQMSLAAAARRTQEITRIENALKRIESGDYGHCAKCDEDIAEKRLESDPTHIFCVNCAR